MNKLSVINPEDINSEDLGALWEETKKRQAELVAKSNDLELKIKNECKEVYQRSITNSENQFAAASGRVKEMIKSRNKCRRSLSKSAGAVFLYAFIIICLSVVVNLFILKLEIVSPVLTYLIFAAASFVISGITVKLRNNQLKKKITQINEDEEILEYDRAEAEAGTQIEREIDYIENEKYKAERAEIDRLMKENNYEAVLNAVMKQKYGDTVMFYFKKFSSLSYYEIKMDGVVLFSSKSVKYQQVRLNPGYHTVTLILTTETSETIYTNTFTYQYCESDLPVFFVCSEVCGISGRLKQVDAEAFQKESGVNIL
ncbi:MAG: hypothetical protein IJ515_05805 [Clostridia bacterium]|nr:hypothetical protein [Clostridia bacterium]